MSTEGGGDREAVTYQFRVPAEDWGDWKDTVPRDVPLDEELRSMIRRAATADSDEGDGEVDSEKRSAIRIRRHAMRLNQGLSRLDTPTDELKDEVNSISRLVDQILD
jgi:hypothetical protein